MKILSFNVNQFLKKESWKPGSNPYNTQIKNIDYLSQYILDFLEESEDNLAILQEVPKNSKFLAKFKKKFESYKIIEPLFDGQAYFFTVAISTKNWSELPAEENIRLSSYYDKNKREIILYFNRVVVVKNKNIVVIGAHIPAISYTPCASILWDDIFYYCKQKNPQIIIGDLNVDKENTIQNRKLSELKSLGYEEAKGEATRRTEGCPPTCDTKSHVDYALVKNINIESYVIDDKHTDLSDHYPIKLSIREQR